MHQLFGEVSVIGQQQQTGGIPVQSPDRINTFLNSRSNDEHYGLAFLGIIGLKLVLGI
jgi:hypothetical protein